MKGIALLTELKKSFTKFVGNLDIETLDIKQQDFEKIQNKAIQESAWVQLMLTLKFWMDDTSASF